MYPVLKEGVSIGTFHYEGSDTIHYYIENADGEEFEISRRLWDALLKADGTRPLDLPDNGQGLQQDDAEIAQRVGQQARQRPGLDII